MNFPPIDFALPGTRRAALPGGALHEDAWGSYALVTGIAPPDVSASPHEQTRAAFSELERALAPAGMDFSHVVRTWLFADGILDWYADLNRARDAFFRAHGVYGRYVPASTGIGWTPGGGARIVMGAFAAKGRGAGDLAVEALPSPLQCPALEYGSSFSRAAEVRTPGWRRVIVSGTASIMPGSHDVAYPGDVDAQIDCAMSAVRAIYGSRGMDFADVSGALVYLKEESFRANWERWLARHPEFPRAHARAIVADVCRPEWLFEIESDAVRTTGAQ